MWGRGSLRRQFRMLTVCNRLHRILLSGDSGADQSVAIIELCTCDLQKIIQGDIIRMSDRIMNVLRSKYLVSYIGYEGMKRTEPLEIPEAALREIIYNALIHRLYTGTWIQMRVYNDRISVWNEGTLPEDFPVEMLLQEHSSRQRNPLIANVFFLAGFVETWGRGIKKIRRALQGVGLPDPVFEENCGGVRVTIQRPRNIANLGAVNGGDFGDDCHGG